MRSSSSHRVAAGFSIIELLIAVIIIGILVSIMIPVLLRRADDARVGAAESDLQHLEDAEVRAGVTTGYVYRFYVLDDLPGGDGRFIPGDPSDVDGIRDEAINPTVAFPTRIFLDYSGTYNPPYDFLQGNAESNAWSRLVRNETEFGWQGPYINYARMRDIDYNDIPEDPWGEEYLLFTPRGLVDQRLGVVVDTYYFVATDGTPITLYGPFFDRFTVLSKGPNRAPGDGTSLLLPDGTPAARFGTGDDLKRQF